MDVLRLQTTPCRLLPWVLLVLGVFQIPRSSCDTNGFDTVNKGIDAYGNTVENSVNSVTRTITIISVVGGIAFIAMIIGCCYFCTKCCGNGSPANNIIIPTSQPAAAPMITVGGYQPAPQMQGYQPAPQIPGNQFAPMNPDTAKVPPPYDAY